MGEINSNDSCLTGRSEEIGTLLPLHRLAPFRFPYRVQRAGEIYPFVRTSIFYSHSYKESTSLASIMSDHPTTQQNPTAVLGSLLSSDTLLWQIVDPEVARENPVEDKHRRLVRSHRSGALDRELKPSAGDRDELAVCCLPELL